MNVEIIFIIIGRITNNKLRINRWSRIVFILVLITFNYDITLAKKRVCVIGAGVAGIAAIRQLSQHEDEIEPIVFERNSDVGGLWMYSDSQDLDENGLPTHSRVYKNLRINVPKQTFAYPDYRSFEGRECHSHVSHWMIEEYLQNYTEHFNLRQYIQFNTLVEKVDPICKSNGCQSTKWTMRTRDLITNKVSTTICDYVMVCNGHFDTARIPKIRGIESFTGRIIHSGVYRTPEQFAGQNVVVLGASVSGIDISVDLSPQVKTIYLSHRHEKIENEAMPTNVIQVPAVIAADNGKLILQDNSTITADAMIYATGYLYTFPFLDKSSGITIDDNFVYPLYKHLVNIEHPTMGFIGVPLGVCNSLFFYFQSKYYTSLILGKSHLPSKTEMLEDAQLPPGIPKKKAHMLGASEPYEWPYYTFYSEAGAFKDVSEPYRIARIADQKLIREHLVDLKEYDLVQLSNGEFDFVRNNGSCPKKIII